MEYKKKLIEVALPLEVINAESAREKSIRHGHPSTLHLWWARRPLAAARAVIWASLVDDPSAHPDLFPTEELQKKERERLFGILSRLVVWENSNNQEVIDEAKTEIMRSTGANPPALLDPFAGGGTIPLEAQRLGLEAHAHDLNPVAVMINKAMIETAPHFFDVQPINPESNRLGRAFGFKGGAGLAEDVKYYGEYVKKEAEYRIGKYYTKAKLLDEMGSGEATPVAWLWTRTVKCPNPACGCEMPLIKSFELSKKNGGTYLEPTIFNKTIKYKIVEGTTKRKGTINRKGAKCLLCGSPVDLNYIRDCGKNGTMGYQLLTVIAEGNRKKIFLPAECDQSELSISRPDEYPDTEIAYYPGCTNCRIYGMVRFSDLMTNRQLLAVNTFSDIVCDITTKINDDARSIGVTLNKGYAEAIKLFLAFGVDRMASRLTKSCLWNTTAETIEQPFGRQAIPMVWTFPETNVFSNSSGGWTSSLEWIPSVLQNLYCESKAGFVQQCDAMNYISNSCMMVSTDPPYYSNVPYADLSDFFYIWLRKMLKTDYPDVFMTMDTPKSNELVAEKFRFDGDDIAAKVFFEDGMLKAFRNVYQYVSDKYPLSVYYAFKETENDEESISSKGWETMLSALIKAGFVIVGTWPVRTERTSGLKNSLNALGSSIVLVCRKRSEKAGLITRTCG